jgi:fatty-acyl-CoA synthase
MYPGEYGRTTPNKPAVIMGSSGTVVTYAELDERSRRLSRLLHERGLVRGDMVAIFAENQGNLRGLDDRIKRLLQKISGFNH